MPAHPDWPALPYPAWRETCETLQLMTQIVGKVRLALTPWLNHSWHAPLYVSARGLATSLIPYGSRGLDIEFDFVDQVLWLRASDGGMQAIPLEPTSIAHFFAQVMVALADLDMPTAIHAVPNELPVAIPFAQDR